MRKSNSWLRKGYLLFIHNHESHVSLLENGFHGRNEVIARRRMSLERGCDEMRYRGKRGCAAGRPGVSHFSLLAHLLDF
jgi:hypothetical protein